VTRQTLAAIIRRARLLLSRRRLDAELREEIDAHIEQRRQALVAEGMDPRDAAFEARRLFGNATAIHERSRDILGFPLLRSMAQDVRYGARLLRRAPLFTLVAVMSIAFGLGGGLMIFTVANAFIFRPVGGASADLHRVYTANQGGSAYGGNSYADYRDFASLASVFEATCATARVRANVTLGGETARHSGALVTPRCFEVLGLPAHAGRLIGQVPSAAPEVVISHALWTRHLGADPAAIGSAVAVNGVTATLVGVAPRGFHGTSFDDSADFWVGAEAFAALLGPDALDKRGHRSFTIYARLKDGVTRDQAQAALTGVATALQRMDPAAWTGDNGAARRVTVARELDSRFADSPGGVSLLLLTVAGAVASVVAIACVNLATMLLARGAARTRELTIRLAIGASRGRVQRQLATESRLIAALGAGIALAATSAGIRLFEAQRPEGIPAIDLAVDWRVALFAAVTAVLATLLFGLAPGAHVVRLAIADGIKGRVTVARTRWLRAGAREALIVVQVTASVALLLVASLFARALSAGAAASPGFDVTGVTLVGVDIEQLDAASKTTAAARLLRAAAAVRDVDAPTIARMVPLIGSSMVVEGGLDGAPRRGLESNIVAPGYFATMSIPIRSGRDFAGRDREGSAPVAIASETLARTLWNTTDAVGRAMIVGGKVVEIVGVAADTRYRGVNEPFRPVVYLPFDQARQERFFIHARTRGGGETLAALDRAVRAVDPRIVVDQAVPLARWLDDMRAPERTTQWIGGAAGIAQFALVLMALWALVSYAVERRTAEIGVRLALGATPRGVVQLVLRPALLLIAAGAILGSAVGFTAGSVLRSQFVGLGALEPFASLPVIAAMAAIAVGAAFVPARRAGRVDPIVALRAE
jgi:predicted permease